MCQKRENYFIYQTKLTLLRSCQDQHGTIKKKNIPITVKMHPELDGSDLLEIRYVQVRSVKILNLVQQVRKAHTRMRKIPRITLHIHSSNSTVK